MPVRSPLRQRDAASRDDILQALATLSTADKARLRYAATLRSIGLAGTTWEDLISEARTRALSGVRTWPSDVPFVAFMLQTMRSIASELRDQAVASGEVLESDLARDEGVETRQGLADLATDDISPERSAAARSAIRQIESLFAGDDEALGVLEALALGESPDEARHRIGIDAVTYASAQRRIRRTLARAQLGEADERVD